MLLECREVVKRYSRQTILDGVDLYMQAGQCVGLTGLNGCGKSTLLKSILDLTAIDAGQILFNGKSHRQIASRQHIAYLPDRFAPPADVSGMVFLDYILKLYGSRASRAAIHEMAESLDFPAAGLTRKLKQLSKGMTQKLGLMACLLSGKSLLILDEPMSGLDPKARLLFKQQIAHLRATAVSILFTSHALADVEELADTVVVLHDTQIPFAGAPDQFIEAYQAENIEQAYMQCIGAS